MGDKHSKDFFGSSTAIIVNTPAKEEPFIYIRCIKKINNTLWEKPSLKQGKVVRLNLGEIIEIIRFLDGGVNSWSTFHKYKDSNTSIEFSRDKNNDKNTLVKIGSYMKMLNFSQSEVLRLLLKHILKEKIKFSTVFNFNKDKLTEAKDNVSTSGLKEVKKNNIEKPQENVLNQAFLKVKSEQKEKTKVEGFVQGSTQKALLINIAPIGELWFPKSTIHSAFKPDDKITKQSFVIDNWILKRNKVLI